MICELERLRIARRRYEELAILRFYIVDMIEERCLKTYVNFDGHADLSVRVGLPATLEQVSFLLRAVGVHDKKLLDEEIWIAPDGLMRMLDINRHKHFYALDMHHQKCEVEINTAGRFVYDRTNEYFSFHVGLVHETAL